MEDIKAHCWGGRKWNANFSPLQVGKNWFYRELRKIASVEARQGWDTKAMRDELGLKKSGQKLSKAFEAHCVDSWVLANSSVRGHVAPDNKDILYVQALRFHRRQLHKFQPESGGIRRLFGGTRSLGFKRGSLVKHPKWGLTYIGGTMDGRITLHSLVDASRLCRNAKASDIKFLAYNSWRFQHA